MNVELLAGGGIHKAFKELGIKATRTYRNENVHYQVWEIDKKDLHLLDEASEWNDSWGWWRYAKGSNMGSAYEFLTVNGQFLIGWKSLQGKDTYDSLIDYFADGLGYNDGTTVAALAKDLARYNGMTIAKLFKVYQG